MGRGLDPDFGYSRFRSLVSGIFHNYVYNPFRLVSFKRALPPRVEERREETA